MDAEAPAGDDDADDDDEPNVGSDGDLEVSISSDTPEGDILPQLAQAVTAAAWDFEAVGDDVTLTSLAITREGYGADETLTGIALYDENGIRVSKVKTFNSEDVANVALLSGGIDIEKGEEMTLFARVNVGGDLDGNGVYTNAGERDTSGDQFALSIVSADDVASNADDVDGDFAAEGETWGVSNVETGVVEISVDGTPSDPTLGEEEAEILKFEIENTSNDNSMYVEAITFEETGSIDEEDEMENFVLYLHDEEVASVASSNDKYISFLLDDPLEIPEGKTYKGSLYADIVGGAGKTIDFEIEDEVDVVIVDDAFGFGARVNGISTFAPTFVTVEAGELTIVSEDAENEEIRADRKDVVAGTLTFVANAGKDLELQKVEISIELDDATSDDDYFAAGAHDDTYDETEIILEDIIDVSTVELAMIGGQVFDLDLEGTSDNDLEVFSNDDIDLLLVEGEEYEFEIRFDTNDLASDPNNGGGNDEDADGFLSGLEINVTMANIGGVTAGVVDADAGVAVIESGDDTYVEDITPSSLDFKSLETTKGDLAATVKTLNRVTKVVGADDVTVLKFDLKAGDASDLEVREFEVTGLVDEDADGFDDGGADRDHIDQYSLYIDGELEETVNGSDITSAGVATFEKDFDVVAEATVSIEITADIADDEGNDDFEFQVSLTGMTAEDDEDDDVDVTGMPLNSNATGVVLLADEGAIAFSEDSSSPSQGAIVTSGETGVLLLALKADAADEPVEIEALSFTPIATEAGIVGELSLHFNGEEVDTTSNQEGGLYVFDSLSDVIVSDSEDSLFEVFLTVAGIGDGSGDTAASADDIELTLVAANTLAKGDDSNNDLTATGDVAGAVTEAFVVFASKVLAEDPGSQPSTLSAALVSLIKLKLTPNNTTEEDATLEELVVNYTLQDDDGAVASVLAVGGASSAKLYSGSNLLASACPAAGVATFDLSGAPDTISESGELYTVKFLFSGVASDDRVTATINVNTGTDDITWSDGTTDVSWIDIGEDSAVTEIENAIES